MGATVRVVATITSPFGTEYVLQINGIEQRTITASHAKEIEADKAQLDGATQELALTRQEVLNLQQQVANLTSQLKDKDTIISAKADQNRLLQQLQSQYALVVDNQQKELKNSADILAMNKPDWVTRFLNRIPVELGFKVAIPLIGAAANLKALKNPAPMPCKP